MTANSVGFNDIRIVDTKPISLNDDFGNRLGNIKFYSITLRLFKDKNLELTREDYGQAVRYNGNISLHPFQFKFDFDYHFRKGYITNVDQNTFTILKGSRFNKYFDFYGNNSIHYGEFKNFSNYLKFEEIMYHNKFENKILSKNNEDNNNNESENDNTNIDSGG